MPSTTITVDHETIVVGAGFAGLAMAKRLRDERRDFVVLEQGSTVGGTWRDNTYPGCACDVQSHMYSFSFAQNPDWTRTFSPQPEIQAYIERTTDRFGLRPSIRLEARMTSATWDEASQTWAVEVNGAETLRCRFLIGALGALNRPAYPKVDGLEDFGGQQFHSMEWPADFDATGKKVAVIGTGASAIQFIPVLAKTAGHLDVFQRTAPWILPKPDRPVPKLLRWVFRNVPGALNAYRQSIYWRLESRVPAFRRPALIKVAQHLAKWNIRKQIPNDPVLRAKVTPDYVIGCKRILMSNTYYRALAKPTVDVHSGALTRVTATGVVTPDGVEHPADVIVYGTGFRVTDVFTPLSIYGTGGRDLNDVWTEGGGVEAYKGATVAGFPNLFFLMGANTGLGHNSVVFMAEAQVEYVIDALKQMDARGLGAVSVRREVQIAYNEHLQEELAGSVWQAGGCRSWYVDADGRNRVLWPGQTFTFRTAVAEFDADKYDLIPASAPAAVPAAA